jgi:hypothetical protein
MKWTYILLMGILSVSACGPNMTLLVYPRTGERIECRALVDRGSGVVINQAPRENCVQQYEGLGFVQVDNLTPQQRAEIIPKSRPLVIEPK